MFGLYAVGIFIGVATVFPFYLTSYGSGGVHQYKDGNYILYNHGTETIISQDYYFFIEKAQKVCRKLTYISLPFLLLGFVGYYVLMPNRNTVSIEFYLRLFVPLLSDFSLSFLAKCYYILSFAHLMLITFIHQDVSEQEFVTRIYIAYVVNFVLAVLLTLIFRKVNRQD